MSHIVIDARLYGPRHTGIGRYTKNLLLALSQLPDFKKYKFSLIVYQNLLSEIKKDLKNNYNLIPTSITHYSINEQLKLPALIKSLKPDLTHFTHFNKPVFYTDNSIITIHDLIKHFYKGQGTTTKNPLLYWPKYLAYRFISETNIKTTRHIIVPSQFWRDYLIKTFKLAPNNITVTYEAVDPKFLCHPEFISGSPTKKMLKPVQHDKSYLLYTGNLYPHKNIHIIFDALKDLPDLKLKIISGQSAFLDKTKLLVNQLGLASQIDFLGFIPDAEFKKLYQKALALVHPSFMEGFSLTGLEAMALNCPVISSNASCLPEVYGNSVLYFDPTKAEQLITQIKKLKNNPKLRLSLIKQGHAQVNKYSWAKTAQQTLNVYKNCLVL